MSPSKYFGKARGTYSWGSTRATSLLRKPRRKRPTRCQPSGLEVSPPSTRRQHPRRGWVNYFWWVNYLLKQSVPPDIFCPIGRPSRCSFRQSRPESHVRVRSQVPSCQDSLGNQSRPNVVSRPVVRVPSALLPSPNPLDYGLRRAQSSRRGVRLFRSPGPRAGVPSQGPDRSPV
jgi:hypothetical protein